MGQKVGSTSTAETQERLSNCPINCTLVLYTAHRAISDWSTGHRTLALAPAVLLRAGGGQSENMRSRGVFRDKVEVARSGANVESILPRSDAQVLFDISNL